MINAISGALASHADAVFLVGGMALNLVVALSLMNPDTAIRRRESFLYGTVLGIMGLTYLGLDMPLSAGSFILGTMLWYLIFVFRAP